MLLQQQSLPLPLDLLALADIANVALIYDLAIFVIAIGNEFHRRRPSIAVHQRQVFVPDITMLMQFAHRVFARFDILENADLPKLLAQEVLTRMAQQIGQKTVDVNNAAAFGIEDQNPILRCLEETPIAPLRKSQFVFRPSAAR